MQATQGTSCNPFLLLSLLNCSSSWTEARKQFVDTRVAKKQLDSGFENFGDIRRFPELVHFSQNLGQSQARENVPNIAWNIPINRSHEPFHRDRKYSEGSDLNIITYTLYY